MGFAFISFKSKDCVPKILEEIDMVKQIFCEEKIGQKLNMKDWEVDKAIPPTDIIWDDV